MFSIIFCDNCQLDDRICGSLQSVGKRTLVICWAEKVGRLLNSEVIVHI